MPLTAEDFRISEVQKCQLNGRASVTFKAHRRGGDSYTYYGQFSAPARTAKRDLWQIAAGNDFIRTPGAPRKLDDGRAVNVILDAPSRIKTAQIGGTVSEAIRIALAAYKI